MVLYICNICIVASIGPQIKSPFSSSFYIFLAKSFNPLHSLRSHFTWTSSILQLHVRELGDFFTVSPQVCSSATAWKKFFFETFATKSGERGGGWRTFHPRSRGTIFIKFVEALSKSVFHIFKPKTSNGPTKRGNLRISFERKQTIDLSSFKNIVHAKSSRARGAETFSFIYLGYLPFSRKMVASSWTLSIAPHQLVTVVEVNSRWNLKVLYQNVYLANVSITETLLWEIVK